MPCRSMSRGVICIDNFHVLAHCGRFYYGCGLDRIAADVSHVIGHKCQRNSRIVAIVTPETITTASYPPIDRLNKSQTADQQLA